MAVKFIIGRAGSGKTHWCVTRTVSACREQPMGDPIIWLVPRQATFQTERGLCCGSGLGGYFRIRVMSLEELGRQVLTELGGSAVPEVTDLGRRMLIGSILRKTGESLEYFGKVARKPGLVAELDQTLGELEKCDADIGQVCESVGDAGLKAKLRDLQVIYSAYRWVLGSDRLDPKQRLQQALGAVRNSQLLRSATVYVDGYYDYTDYEAKMLASIAGVCTGMYVTTMMDRSSPLLANGDLMPEESSLFHRTEMGYRKLWITLRNERVEREPPLILEKTHRFKSEGLAQIERWENGKEDEGVEFIETPDMRAEVDAAARKIREMVAGGMRYRDVGILVRDLDEYHDLLAVSLKEHGIPFFADRRRTAAHHPLIQFVRAVVAVNKSNWAQEEMMTLVKSGLAGLSHDQGDELENFVLLHGIRGARWMQPEPWIGRHPNVDDEVAIPAAEAADKLRRIVVDKLKPYADRERGKRLANVKTRTVELLGVLEAFDVRGKLVGWIGEAENKGRLEEADEHRQVWGNTVDLLQQLVDVLGEEVGTLDEYQGMLEAALETFDLALTPPTVDQVLVGPVDRTRTPGLKATIVIGLNEGQFPRGGRKETVFSDGDRRTLRAKNVEVDPDSRRRVLDEEFLGYVAFTRASRQLILIRHLLNSEGKPVSAGSLWRQARAMAPAAKNSVIPPHAKGSTQTIATPRQLVTDLMRWVRSGKSDDGNVWPALYQWLANRECRDDEIDVMRMRAWRALSYHNDAQLSAETAARLFEMPLKASVAQMEAFAACPFKHFARYGLGLLERGERIIDGRDLVRIYREMMEAILSELLRTKKDWRGIKEPEIARLISSSAGKLRATLQELMRSSARNEYLLKRVEQTLDFVLRAQRAAAERGAFVPRSGKKKTTLSLISPAGHQVEIVSRVDRIDVAEDGNAIIFDYRLGTARLSLAEVYWGISLALIAAMAGAQDDGTKAAGAFQVQMTRKLCDRYPTIDEKETNLDLAIKPRGIFDEQAAGWLDRQMAPGERSEVIAAHVKVDGTFGNRGNMDGVTAAELAGLLKRVRRNIGVLADQILGGNVGVKPYRMGTKSPCSACGYRDMCRFEIGANGYRTIAPMGRLDVLKKVTT